MLKVAREEVKRRLEEFKSAAKKAGIKLTHQRLEIFRVVASSVEHPSAEFIHRAVLKKSPTVSLDTVYRTLWLLTDLGLLNTLGPRQESTRFDANLAPHHHYVCIKCGLVRDFDSEKLNTLEIPDTVRRLGRVVATRVEVRGVCDHCAQTSESESESDSESK